MFKEKFQGTGTALVTPFRQDMSVDEDALARLVEFQIGGGVDMIFPCGTTGEGATLESDEWERVIARVVEWVDGRVLVIAGAGCNSTARAQRLTRRAAQLGADGVLSVGPYYNKPKQEGYYAHFKAVTEVNDLPVVVYNVPGRTGGNINAETLLRLAELPGIVAVKEASGDFLQIMEVIRCRKEGFRVLSGDDALTLPMIAAGADGAVSVVSNEVPAMYRELVDRALEGDFDGARTLQYCLLPLIGANFIESNPIPVKAVLAMMGLVEEAYRLPLTPPSAQTRETLHQIASDLGLIMKKGANLEKGTNG